jgi:hypothetical protein
MKWLKGLLNFLFAYFFETGSYYVSQADLKLTNLLPQPSECWDYRYVSPGRGREGGRKRSVYKQKYHWLSEAGPPRGAGQDGTHT